MQDPAAAEGCINGKTKAFKLAGPAFLGGRAMLNKVWFREILRKWFSSKPERPPARIFSQPKFQDQVEIWYLVYRWLICASWLSIIVCSIFEIGSVKPIGGPEKWLIFLTNWGLLFGLAQATLALVLVHKRRTLQKTKNFDAHGLEYGRLERTYWFLNVVTTTAAIGVTVTYWCLVHDPRIHQVDALNIMIHVCNSLLMLLDFAVTGVPYELRFFWWCAVLVVFYLGFSVVYYLAGGLDKHGHRYIYRVLDWSRPGRTLLVCTGGLIFVALVHCLLYLLARLRNRMYEKRDLAPVPAGDELPVV